MNTTLHRVLGCIGTASLLVVGLGAQQLAQTSPQSSLGEPSPTTFATPFVTPGAIQFQVAGPTGDLKLTVRTPSGKVRSEVIPAGTAPQILVGPGMRDGSYRWELRDLGSPRANRGGKGTVASGGFLIEEGEVITPGEEPPAPENVLHSEDTWIDGNLAVGTAVTGTETFTQNSILVKEFLIRMVFEDTSTGLNTNDWSFLFNDFAGDDYFAVRDQDGASNILTLMAGAPANSVFVNASGQLGLGTSTPSAPIDLVTPAGTNAAMVMSRDDGATGLISAAGSVFTVGATSEHTTQFLAGSGGWKMKLYTDQSLEMRTGATCTTGGVWTDNSDFSSRTNVRPVNGEEALQTLLALNPVSFTTQGPEAESHVGFNAAEAPDMVVSNDRKGIAPMDVTAILTKVVQEQQKTIEALERRISELEHRR